jgi:hypothetical protein
MSEAVCASPDVSAEELEHPKAKEVNITETRVGTTNRKLTIEVVFKAGNRVGFMSMTIPQFICSKFLVPKGAPVLTYVPIDN